MENNCIFEDSLLSFSGNIEEISEPINLTYRFQGAPEDLPNAHHLIRPASIGYLKLNHLRSFTFKPLNQYFVLHTQMGVG